MGLFGGFNLTEQGPTGNPAAFPPWQANGVDGEIFVDCLDAAYDLSVTQTAAGIAATGGVNKSWGGVLAPNGKIYGVPNNGSNVFVINPSVDSYTNIGTTTGRYAGGVLAPNGKIYAAPYDVTTTCLSIDPVTDTFTTFGSVPLPPLPNQNNGWVGGVVTESGLLYFIPHNSQDVLVINPNDNSISYFGTADTTGTAQCAGACLGPNGKIYCAPWNKPGVLVIDPTTNTTTTITSNVPGGTTKYAGAVLAENGKIYMIPYASTLVLVIDPSNDTASTFSSFSGSGDNYAGALGPDGKIYSPPFGGTNWRVINPDNNTVATVASGGRDFNRGATLATNGCIYGIPGDGTDVAKILVAQSPTLDPNGPLSRYLNKL
jgi:hypothetical protein